MQNQDGALKARDKILRNNPNHYQEIGKLGGRKSRGGGFTGDSERASRLGAIGGALGSNAGYRHTKEAKRKMSEAHKRNWAMGRH